MPFFPLGRLFWKFLIFFSLAQITVVAGFGLAIWATAQGDPGIDPGDVQPTMQFTPAETHNFRMERPFLELPHALRVQFVNPEADWQQDEIIVLDDGYSYRGVDARGNPSSAPEPERTNMPPLSSSAWSTAEISSAATR